MKHGIVKYSLLSIALFPFLAFAQSPAELILIRIGIIFRLLIPLLITLALVFFLWGIAKFVFASGQGDEQGRETGKRLMVWGLIALFVMISVWGLVLALQTTFGIFALPPPGSVQLLIPFI